MADTLGSPISTETLENLQRILLGATPSSCTVIGEWLDFSCRTAPGAAQATLHTRKVTVLWCCSNPNPSGGECAPCDGLSGAKDGDCVKVYDYGSWRDTGQPCAGGAGAGGIESMERTEVKPIPEPGDPPLVMARAGGAAGARVRKAGTRARAPAGRQGRTAR